jgi:hypothetical protein
MLTNVAVENSFAAGGLRKRLGLVGGIFQGPAMWE